MVVSRGGTDEIVLAFITSQSVMAAAPTAHSLLPTKPEFHQTGLKVPSQVRLDKLATLHRRLVTRRLGYIGPKTTSSLATCLRHVFDL